MRHALAQRGLTMAEELARPDAAGACFFSAISSAVTCLVGCRMAVYKYSATVAFGRIGLMLISREERLP
jgi:hypothetical protein